MTDTIREQVLSAIFAALETLIEDGKPVVDRNITTAPQVFPTVALRDGGHDVPDPTPQQKKYDMLFGVELFVEADSDKELGPALNALYGRVVKVLEADGGGYSLGGLAQDLKELEFVEVAAVQMEGGRPAMTGTISFAVTFWTKPFDPFVNGI